VKIFFSIVLVLVSILACYGEDIYLSFSPPQPGKILYLSVRSQQPFDFDQEKAFGSKRNVAIAQYTPLYTYIPERIEATKKKMQDLMKKASTLQSQAPKDGVDFDKYLRQEFGASVGTEAAAQLLQYPDLKNLLEAVLAIEDSILQGKIVGDPKPLQGKKTVEVLYPKQAGTVAYPASEVVTLEQARETIQNKISQVFWQIDKGVLNPVIQVVIATMGPNLKYDQMENDRRIEEIIRKYPSKTIPYEAGDVLVPFRKKLNEEDVLLLLAHQDVKKETVYEGTPWVLFSIILAVGLYNLLMTGALQSWYRAKPPCLLHLSVLIMAVVLLKLFLLFTSFPVQALPFAFVPLLLLLLYPEKVAVTLSTLLGALLVSFFGGATLRIALFLGFGAIAAILATPVVKKRSQIIVPSLIVGCTQAAAFLFGLLDGNTIVGWIRDANHAATHLLSHAVGKDPLSQMGWAFASGIVSGPVALLLLPPLERVWNTASAFELFKYTDFDRPLMKQLLTKAPGTYQHSMTVAQLAQAASEKIGANTLLVRIGAYYHDIGKTGEDPKHFTENQFGGPNPHENLPPEESVRIITNHVVNGLRLGREAELPEVILDFIPQHHGTLLVDFFYDKACKSGRDAPVRETDFRYGGPKPRSVETAIVMIADAVEAASRTLHEPTRESLDGMVSRLIEKRIADGQFDECDLSTRDLAKIRESLVDSLIASLHVRVEYPWQKEAGG